MVLAAQRTRSTPPARRIGACALVLLSLCAPAAAELVRDGGASAAPEARAVFERLRMAWEIEDQQALADLVHSGGLRINSPATVRRVTTYSPSQAFYYFKNLFQTHDTDAFILSRVQETSESPRIHAMVEWHRHRSGTPDEETLRLMLVLTRDGTSWRLSEISTIR